MARPDSIVSSETPDLRPQLVALGYNVRREHLVHELHAFGGFSLDEAGRIVDALESEDDDPRQALLERLRGV